MSRSRKHWRERLKNQTPRYITLAGYLLSLGILAAAGSTWFFNTDVTAQGTAVLRPQTRVLRADRDAVVLDSRFRPGATVRAGEALCQLLDDPESVANYRLAHDLRQRLAEFERLPGDPAKARVESLRAMLSALPPGEPTRRLESPVPGWLVSDERSTLEEDAPGTGVAPTKPEPRVVSPGTVLFNVASPAQVMIEVSTSSNRAPTVQPGESVSLLLADWDNHDTAGRIQDIATTASIEIPCSTFKPAVRDQLKITREVRIDIFEQSVSVKVSAGNETINLSLAVNRLPTQITAQIKVGAPLTVIFPELNGQRVRAKWDALQCMLNLAVDGPSLSPQVRQALMVQLAMGRTNLPASRCWVKIGTQRLFLRLFGK